MPYLLYITYLHYIRVNGMISITQMHIMQAKWQNDCLSCIHIQLNTQNKNPETKIKMQICKIVWKKTIQSTVILTAFISSDFRVLSSTMPTANSGNSARNLQYMSLSIGVSCSMRESTEVSIYKHVTFDTQDWS